jgi:hypothetical protein
MEPRIVTGSPIPRIMDSLVVGARRLVPHPGLTSLDEQAVLHGGILRVLEVRPLG